MANVQSVAILSHQSPGRLRLRIPSKKGDGLFFQSLKDQLSTLSGVERIDVNPVTGSILLVHSIDAEKIAQFAREKGLFETQWGSTKTSYLHQEVTKAFNILDERTKGFTGGGINLGAMASLALIAAGTYQVFRGNFAAIPWYTAYWYGLNLFLKSKAGGNGGGE
ncbi:MAG TPA: hypothetical protein VMV04_15625 [Thermodesulfobacteriota bacterium]|nr:hypothetical protein [Thermodesulfobacteriota bacterium]